MLVRWLCIGVLGPLLPRVAQLQVTWPTAITCITADPLKQSIRYKVSPFPLHDPIRGGAFENQIEVRDPALVRRPAAPAPAADG